VKGARRAAKRAENRFERSPSEPAGKDLSFADDATLAQALIDGDPRAPAVVWSRFSGLVRRIVRRALGPQGDYEDVVQEVFASLLAKPATLRTPVAVRAFIVSVTLHNVSAELRRRRQRRLIGLAPTPELPEMEIIDPNPESRRALVHFRRILERVRERDRRAFVLRFIEGLAVAAVADALETSAPTARRRFNRAYRRVSLLAARDPFLRDYLGDLGAAPVEQAWGPRPRSRRPPA
jgi:RNA polymerase sigma-70 factor, ECF subfamily